MTVQTQQPSQQEDWLNGADDVARVTLDKCLETRANRGSSVFAFGDYLQQSYFIYASRDRVIISNSQLAVLQVLHVIPSSAATAPPPEKLYVDAVAFRVGKEHGHIAVAMNKEVHLFVPTDTPEGPRWVQEGVLVHLCHVRSISWSAAGVLLAAGQYIYAWMYQGKAEDGSVTEPHSYTTMLMRQKLANEVVKLEFSPDARLFASVSKWDRFVKVWRFLPGKGADNFVFLPHPRAITDFQWKRYSTQERGNVLVTTSRDNVIRFWRETSSSGDFNVALTAVIDVNRQATKDPGFLQSYLVYLLHAQDLQETGTQHEKMMGLLKSTPDLIFQVFGDGAVAVWGIQNLDTTANAPAKVSLLLKVNQQLDPQGLGRGLFGDRMFIIHPSRAQLSASLQGSKKGNGEAPLTLELITSSSDSGNIARVSIDLAHLFFGSNAQSPFYTCHRFIDGPQRVDALFVSRDGHALATWSRQIEALFFYQETQSSAYCEIARFRCGQQQHLHVSWLMHNRQALVLGSDIIVFNLAPSPATVVRAPVPADVVHLKVDSAIRNVYAVSESGRSFYHWTLQEHEEGNIIGIGAVKEVHLDVPLWTDKRQFFAPTSACQCASPFHGTVLAQSLVDPQEFAIVHVIERHLVSQGTFPHVLGKPLKIRFSCSGDVAVIWESRHFTVTSTVPQLLQVLHLDASIHGAVSDCAWSSLESVHCLLAVAQYNQIIVYARQSSSKAAFVPLLKRRLPSYHTASKSDALLRHVSLAWSMSGFLFVAMPNEVRILRVSEWLLEKKFSDTMLPLPTYHPVTLLALSSYGQFDVMEKVLTRTATFIQANTEDTLDNNEKSLTSVPYIALLEAEKQQQQQQQKQSKYDSLFDSEPLSLDFDVSFAPSNKGPSSDTKLTLPLSQFFRQFLSTQKMPNLTKDENQDLACITEAIFKVQQEQSSLDACGRRYLFAFYLRTERQKNSNQILSLSADDSLWALHSNSQNELLGRISDALQGKLTWLQCRSLGLGYWLRSTDVLRKHVENMARDQYLSKPEKDPIDCALFYLAMQKKKIWHGLWRTCSSHPDKQKMVDFLNQDFNEGRWKAAAMKNAFALLGKQRYEYAAAFFLLAGELRDAVNVCIKHLQDPQLALVIARLFEGGDSGPGYRQTLQSILEQDSLPHELRCVLHVLQGAPLKALDVCLQSNVPSVTIFMFVEQLWQSPLSSQMDYYRVQEWQRTAALQVAHQWEALQCPEMALMILLKQQASNDPVFGSQLAMQLSETLPFSFAVLDNLPNADQLSEMYSSSLLDYLEYISQKTQCPHDVLMDHVLKLNNSRYWSATLLPALSDRYPQKDYITWSRETVDTLLDELLTVYRNLQFETVDETRQKIAIHLSSIISQVYRYTLQSSQRLAAVSNQLVFDRMQVCTCLSLCMQQITFVERNCFGQSVDRLKIFEKLLLLVMQGSLREALLEVENVMPLTKDKTCDADDPCLITVTRLLHRALVLKLILLQIATCCQLVSSSISRQVQTIMINSLQDQVANGLEALMQEFLLDSNISLHAVVQGSATAERLITFLGDYTDPLLFLSGLEVVKPPSSSTAAPHEAEWITQVSETVHDLAFIQDKRFVVLCHRTVFEVQLLQCTIRPMQVMKTPSRLTLSSSNLPKLLDASSKRLTLRKSSSMDNVNSLSPDSTDKESAGSTGVNVTGNEAKEVKEKDSQISLRRSMEGNTIALAVHPKMPFYLTLAQNNLVSLWQFDQSVPLYTWNLEEKLSSIVAFDAFGDRFAVVTATGQVLVWRFEAAATETKPLTIHQTGFKTVADITFLYSASLLVVVGINNDGQRNVTVWDSLMPATRSSFVAHEQTGAARVAFSSSVQCFVSAGKTGDLSVFDAKSMRLIRTIAAQQLLRYLDCNDTFIVTGSVDGEIKAFDWRTGQLLRSWQTAGQRKRTAFDNPIGNASHLGAVRVVNGEVYYSYNEHIFRFSLSS